MVELMLVVFDRMCLELIETSGWSNSGQTFAWNFASAICDFRREKWWLAVWHTPLAVSVSKRNVKLIEISSEWSYEHYGLTSIWSNHQSQMSILSFCIVPIVGADGSIWDLPYLSSNPNPDPNNTRLTTLNTEVNYDNTSTLFVNPLKRYRNDLEALD